MKELMYQIAEAVEQQVKALERHDGQVLGRNPFGDHTHEIDVAAENAALSVIKETGIPLDVLSEEIGFIDNGGEKLLVMDPIDGSFNAVHGVPFYSFSIALGDKTLSDIEMGLVRNLVTGDTFFAERGHGATSNGASICTAGFRKRGTLFSVNLGKAASPSNYLVAKRTRVRSLGAASLEMCLLATGAYDLYYCVGPQLRVVDIAASTLIVREAGGEVYNERFKRLDLPLTTQARAGVIAVADERWKDEIRDCIQDR